MFLSPAPEVGVAGETLHTLMRSRHWCPNRTKVTVKVSVLDPSNEPLPLAEGEATRTPVQGLGGELDTVVVTRPPVPGRYHFVAQFEPNLGSVQVEVFVAENRRDAGPDIVVENAPSELSQCKQLDVSDAGQLLCLSPTLRMFARDGAVLGSVPAAATREGPVFWALDSAGDVTRWVERPDGGFLQSPVERYGSRARAMAPSTGALLLAANDEIIRLQPTDSGFADDSFRFTALNSPIAIWGAGAEYVFVADEPNLECGNLYDAGPCTANIALFNRVGAAGNEPGGLWVAFDDFARGQARSLVRVSGQGELLRFDLPELWHDTPRVDAPWDTSPTFVSDAGALFVSGARGDQLVVQRYPDLPFINATSRWVAFRWGANGVALFRR